MRIVLLGSGAFAVPSFEAVVQKHDVPALITRPMRSGKGVKQVKHPTLEVAERAGLPVRAPESVNAPEAIEELRQMKPDLLLVCDYGQILSPEALSVAPLGGVNLHGSLLPKYRGAAPVQWAVYHGEAVTGVTVIHMTPRLDAGPCLVQKQVAVGPTETAAELEGRLALLGVEAVEEAIAMLQAWDRVSPLGEIQDKRLATKAPRLSREQGHVNWRQSAEQIARQVRAFKPWPGTFAFVRRGGGEPLRVILDAVSVAEAPPGAPPGEVLSVDQGRLIVATGEGGLSLERVQPAGKRAMEAREFLNGHPLRPGDRFE